MYVDIDKHIIYVWKTQRFIIILNLLSRYILYMYWHQRSVRAVGLEGNKQQFQ